MKVKENTHLLFIEPEKQKSLIPVNDELTKLTQKLLDTAKLPEYAYKGFHVCVCGETSDNNDHIIINGMITNSLAVHYMRFHREEVPMLEIDKLLKIKEEYQI